MTNIALIGVGFLVLVLSFINRKKFNIEIFEKSRGFLEDFQQEGQVWKI